VWRDTLGDSVTSGTAADGHVDGVIDELDFFVWRENFGTVGAEYATLAGAASAAHHLVPEPGTLILSCLAALLVPAFRRGNLKARA
jgi:hypothetical protein